jgi:hypothetical protein
MRKTLLLLLFINFYAVAKGQKKIISTFFSTDTTKHNSFLPLPIFSYSQENGISLGTIGIYSFYVDKTEPNIKVSQAYGAIAASTKKQVLINFKADVWTKKNKYHFITEAKYADQPFNFFGIGNQTNAIDKDVLNLSRLKLNGELENEISRNFYLGGGISYENLVFEDQKTGGIYTTSNLMDKDGGQFLFLKATSFYDTRDQISYTSKGLYLQLQYSFAPNVFGHPNFSGSLITVNAKKFHKLNSVLNLALNATYEGIYSKNPKPFYMLRQLGNDQYMRGYYTGRFRDENLITSQAELRWRPTPRLGMVAFGGTGLVYAKNLFSNKDFKPNYGIGARLFFDLEKAMSIRFDYAMGEKLNSEKRISGFYISLGEAF